LFLTSLGITQNKSAFTHGQTNESTIKQESEENNNRPTDADMEYGQRAETGTMQKA